MGQSETNSRIGSRARLWAGVCIAVSALAVPSLALAHRERPSYFPDPRPDRSITPAAGGKVPKARSLASAVTGFGPGDVRVVCKGTGGSVSLAIVRRTVARAVARGYRLRPSQPKIQMTGPRGPGLCAANKAPRRGLRLPRRPGRGLRLRQQRPRRDHARALHRAGVARRADQRPALRQPDPARHGGRAPLPRYEYQVDLPQRPEPDLRPGPRGPGRAAAEPAARQPPGHPGRGPVRALQPPDRGLGRQARGRHPRRRQAATKAGAPRRGRSPTPRTSSCASIAPTASSPATC